ncbi:MAG: site-specific DNA-methyltransferase [Pseudoflavonifractor sp.]|nr:site-specific DNA-methyltransferase [Pseudoflavonifractor sp.]
MNKTELAKKIQSLEGLDNEEKTALLDLLRRNKKYGLVWEEKPEDIEDRLRDELPILIERNDDKVHSIISDNPEAPNHLIIEGDNLATLTELSYTHAGKIDVMYIDPPYNTRKKDFKYNDTFIDPDDDFSHSTWLSFISKRIRIAKQILSDNGVFFLQIDDREYAPVKLLCDGIFGESNSIGPFIQNKLNAKNDTLNVQRNHEYILCYRKMPLLKSRQDGRVEVMPTLLQKFTKERAVLKDKNRFFFLNDSITTRGEGGTLNARPNLGYSFYFNPATSEIRPIADYDVEMAKVSNIENEVYTTDEDLISNGFIVIRPPKVRGKLGCWTWDINKATRDIDLLYVKQTKNRFIVHKRTFVSEEFIEKIGDEYVYREQTSSNAKSIIEFSTNDGTEVFTSIMGYETGFNNPKNLDMLMYLISLFPNKECTVLDFFAGTGTTMNAVLSLNEQDGGKRVCILTTNNEKSICEEVTYPRNQKIIEGYISYEGVSVKGLRNNNLRYYRTEFLPRERSVKNMRELVQSATGLLCIKNDNYTEILFGGRKMNPKYARFFDNGKQKMLIIYEERAIPFIANIIKTMPEDTKIMVYVFSHGSYAYNDEFAEVADKVELCALPQAIYDAYQKVLPKRKPKFLPDELVEEIEEAEAAENQGLFSFNNEVEEGGEA